MEKLRDFETLQELRDYLDTIPEEKWRKYSRGDSSDPNAPACAIGHVEIAMYGRCDVCELFPDEDSDPAFELLNKLIPGHHYMTTFTSDNEPSSIASVNNGAPDGHIKETVVAYLDEKIALQNNNN